MNTRRFQLIFSSLLLFSLLSACAAAPSGAPTPLQQIILVTGATPVPQPTSSGTLTSRGTPDEAKAMLQKAVDHYNTVGRTQALADFTGRVVPFFDRDLYVACIDSTLTQSANGGFPDLVGSTVEPISRAAWDAATTSKVDSVSYEWLNPANGNMEPKTFFYEKVGTDVCGVGAYTP